MADKRVPEHGGQLPALASHFGVSASSLLDFSASINPLPPTETLIDALCMSMRARGVLTCYPDSNYTALKQAIAPYASVDVSSICIGNGLMPLLAAALQALGTRKCLVLVPAFSGYERVMAACGVERSTLMLREEDEFAIDLDRVLVQLKSAGADTFYLANPHSPSGRLTASVELVGFLKAAADLGVNTVVDEAFIDYVPEESLSREAAQTKKLVVLRSLTKFFAMPGLRVGYAIAHRTVRARLDAAIPLWPVDSLAAQAACLALRDTTSIQEAKQSNMRERVWLADRLRALGLRVFSAANYLLIRLNRNLDGLDLWRRLVVEHGIVVRSCANFEGLDAQYFRIAVRTRSENQRLIDALSRLLASS